MCCKGGMAYQIVASQKEEARGKETWNGIAENVPN